MPKAVRDIKGAEEPKAERLPLETSEYQYVDKFYNGIRVITIADFSHFTNAGLSRSFITRLLKENCEIGKDYFVLNGMAIAQFKIQNPKFSRKAPTVFLITKTGVEKIIGNMKTNAGIAKLFLGNSTPELPAKSSSVVEVSLEKEPKRDNLFAKYERLGTYTKERAEKLLEKRGICINGDNCLPISVAKDFFVPLAVDTVVSDENKGQGCVRTIEILDDRRFPDADYTCELKALNSVGFERTVSLHNAFLAGKITFYKKGTAPVSYAQWQK